MSAAILTVVGTIGLLITAATALPHAATQFIKACIPLRTAWAELRAARTRRDRRADQNHSRPSAGDPNPTADESGQRPNGSC